MDRSAPTRSPAEVSSGPRRILGHLSALGADQEKDRQSPLASASSVQTSFRFNLMLMSCQTRGRPNTGDTWLRPGSCFVRLWLSRSEIIGKGIQAAHRPLGSQVASTERNRSQAEVRAKCRVLSTASGKKQKVWGRRGGGSACGRERGTLTTAVGVVTKPEAAFSSGIF